MTEKILLIDDDPDFLEALAYLLRHEGFDIALAYDGQLGLEKAETHRIGLIITDLVMPNRSGVELIKCLRVQTRLRQKPIFVVTAHQDHAAAALAAGATQVFHKPLHFDCLLNSIQQIITESS